MENLHKPADSSIDFKRSVAGVITRQPRGRRRHEWNCGGKRRYRGYQFQTRSWVHVQPQPGRSRWSCLGSLLDGSRCNSVTITEKRIPVMRKGIEVVRQFEIK